MKLDFTRLFSILILKSKLLLGVLFLTFSIPIISAKPEQILALRAIQSRSFNTNNQKKMIQAISSTLQDMGYIIIRTNDKIGFVTATHFSDDIIEMTVTTQPTKKAIIVRVSARVNNLPLGKNEVFYQTFFNQLSQATFLNANAIY